MDKKIYNLLPQVVKDLLFQSEGYLVGSSVNKLINGESVRDFDILVDDLKNYKSVISAYKDGFIRFTTFGGMNLNIEGFVIDIWYEQSLGKFIQDTPEPGKIYLLKGNKIITIE